MSFSAFFSATPTLLVGVASDNDNAAVVARTRNLTSTSFQVRLQEEEAADGIHANETVSWVAIDQGAGTNNGKHYHSGRTPNAVTQANYNISLSGFSNTPIFLCHDDTFDGSNTCSTRYRTLNSTTATVFIEEEQSLDEETNHISEVVSFLAWASAGDITSSGDGSSAIAAQVRDIQPAPAPGYEYGMGQNYPNPFNPRTTIQFTLDEPGFATLDVFNVAGERVESLVSRHLEAGRHVYDWNASGRASGVYFYRLNVVGHEPITRRMTLLK